MPLEDSSVVDMMFPTPDGHLLLVITDSGGSEDADRGMLLIAKLATYAHYLARDQFRAEHPGKSPSDARIRVACRRAPTESMSSIQSIQLPSPSSIPVPVEFERFGG